MRKLLWLVPLGWLLITFAWAFSMAYAAWTGAATDSKEEAVAVGVVWFLFWGLIPGAMAVIVAWIVNRREPEPMSYDSEDSDR